MKTKLKSLLALALSVLIGHAWAAELVIPYSFEGKIGNTECAYEYKVKMPSEALTSFTTTIRYAGGSHRVEILSVKLLDGETTYTAEATGTEGTEVVEAGASYSGGNNYHNIYTFTNDAGFTANKVYTLQANLKVTNANPNHNGNIKVSGGITLEVQPFSFGVNFKTADAQNIYTTTGAGFAKGDYAAPVNWANYTADGGNHATYTVNATAIDVSWGAFGSHNSGCSTDTDAGKLLHGYLDDAANGGRTKATVTISGLPENKKYAVALVLSGDGNGDANFNNRFSPVWINNEVYAYNSEATLVKGDAAKEIQYWGSRAASAAAGLVEGTNVMFVEGLSGGAISITSAMDNWNVSRLTIAGVQVWVTDEAAEAPAAPEDKETISLNFYSSQGSVSGEAGLVAADGWNNLGNSGSKIALNVWTGEMAVSYPMTLTYSSGGGHQWTDATDAFLKGYLDDKGNRAQVSLTGIPFEKYSVIVYAATDTANYKFRSVTINGQAYIGTPGATTLGYALPVYNNTHARYGASRALTAAYGTNALRVDGLSGDLTIAGGANQYSARGCIAAIQIINTGASLSDEQVIDWTAQPVDQLKVSALPELTKPSVKLKLADGAILEIDDAIVGHRIEIVGNNVTVNVTNLEISQAAAQAIFPGATTVTTAYTETFGIEVDGINHPYFFRGTKNATYNDAANWYIGKRVMGEQTKWLSVSGDKAPGMPDSAMWQHILLDGEMMDTITRGEDGYKTITSTSNLEGWNPRYTVINGAQLVISGLQKIQNGDGANAEWRVDETSKITFNGTLSTGNRVDFYVKSENGVTASNLTLTGSTNYELDSAGSVVVGALNGTATINGVELNLGDSALNGRKIVSRKLIGFTSSNATFATAEDAVVTSVDTVAPEAAEILQDVGQYKFEKKADGYYVDYVAYAETDEIGAMNTWTKGEDALWATAGNWSSGSVPAEGATATIAINEDTTITIPEAGVTVDTLIVSGEGTLTIAGGKITATKVIMNGAGVTATQATLDAAVVQGTKKTECLTFDIAENKAFTMLVKDCALTKKGDAKLEFKKPASTAIFDTVNVTLEKGELALVLGDGNSDPLIADTTFTYVDADSDGEADGSLTNWGWVHSTTTTTFVVPENVTGKAFVNGNLTDTGAVIKRGDGVLLLGIAANSNAGTYTGTTTIEAGTINYSVSGGPTLSGVISGAGKVGLAAGTLTLTANNTYTGGTVIAEGAALTVSNAAALGTGAITGAGTLVCNGVLPANTTGLTEVENWTGTVKVQNFTGGTGQGAAELNLDAYGNANSVVGLANVAGWVGNGTVVENLKLSGSFSQNNGSSSTPAKITIKKLSGAGNFNGPSGNDWQYVFIVNDCSEFTGSVNLKSGGHGGQIGLIIGTEPTGYAPANYKTHITVMADGVANVGVTWMPATGAGGKTRVYGTIGGAGSIASVLEFFDGAIIDTSVTATGDVTLNGTVTVSGEAGATVLTCPNAASLDLTKFAAPAGLKCVAENGAVKLAVANANVPFNPATAESMSVEVAAATEEAALAMVDIQRPAGVGDAVVSAEDYAAYFTKTATGEPGNWTVTVSLKDDVKPVVGGTTDDADDAFTVDADGVTIAINNYKPGLYYGIRSATELGALKTVGAVEVAVEGGKINVAKSTGDSAFYQVVVDVKPFGNEGAEGGAEAEPMPGAE